MTLDYIKHLPKELQLHIILFGGLDLAVKVSNLYTIKRILQSLDLDWYDIMMKFETSTVRYLIKTGYSPKSKTETNKSYMMDTMIESNNLNKLFLLDELFPVMICSVRAYDFAKKMKYNDIVAWLDINRPNRFIGMFMKHSYCTRMVFPKRDYVIQPTNIYTCNCLKCGGDGKGYVN